MRPEEARMCSLSYAGTRKEREIVSPTYCIARERFVYGTLMLAEARVDIHEKRGRMVILRTDPFSGSTSPTAALVIVVLEAIEANGT